MFTRVILAGHSLVVQPSAIVWHRHRDTLEDLQIQARGYGIGLGAWLTKVFLDPRTARIALARLPRVARGMIVNAQHSRSSKGPHVLTDELWKAQLAKVQWLERRSMALGPVNYLRERRRADRAA